MFSTDDGAKGVPHAVGECSLLKRYISLALGGSHPSYRRDPENSEFVINALRLCKLIKTT